MRAVDLIRKKRDGNVLATEEIEWLIKAYTHDEVRDDQMAAFAMAVFFQGMSPKETATLTDSMM
ncbi:MAG: pyrimidine-nucleoside phosphorylase, partial [Myxococcota bacterium]|nr:pyrimidine-nucleoside phosphorylase [Myxococcota bacterium]